MPAPEADHGTWVIDLDGVIWLSADPIPGSAEAVAALRAAGHGVLFATNNAAPTLAELTGRLARAGIAVTEDEVVTSAQAAASMLEPGSSAVVCGDAGVVEALERRGVAIVPAAPADAVVVGWTRRFDFAMLADAATAVRTGARFIGTNEDATHPTPERLLPGSGALLAAVATAAQATPEVAGKPHDAMVALVRARAPPGRDDGGGPPRHRRRAGAPAGRALRPCGLGRHLRRARAHGGRTGRARPRPRRPGGAPRAVTGRRPRRATCGAPGGKRSNDPCRGEGRAVAWRHE